MRPATSSRIMMHPPEINTMRYGCQSQGCASKAGLPTGVGLTVTLCSRLAGCSVEPIEPPQFNWQPHRVSGQLNPLVGMRLIYGQYATKSTAVQQWESALLGILPMQRTGAVHPR